MSKYAPLEVFDHFWTIFEPYFSNFPFFSYSQRVNSHSNSLMNFA